MFFQNLFEDEFRGNWVLSDRQYVLTFTVPANQNKSDYHLAWVAGPWNLTGNTELTVNWAHDTDLKMFHARTIDISGATVSETTAHEVAAALNADEFFKDHFQAYVKDIEAGETVLIRAKSGRRRQTVRFYVSNGGAESVLRFNKKAGVAELPGYFTRHTIERRFEKDSDGRLIALDETDAGDQAIITDAGFDYTAMKEDWELLTGRASGLFMFRKQTVDGSSRVTRVIEYGAGAKEGDFARRIDYTYTGAKTEPDQITEVPHTLTSGDLVTPPKTRRTRLPRPPARAGSPA